MRSRTLYTCDRCGHEFELLSHMPKCLVYHTGQKVLTLCTDCYDFMIDIFDGDIEEYILNQGDNET